MVHLEEVQIAVVAWYSPMSNIRLLRLNQKSVLEGSSCAGLTTRVCVLVAHARGSMETLVFVDVLWLEIPPYTPS